jgi:hypothetical protein
LAFDAAQALLAKPNSRRKKRYVLHLAKAAETSEADRRVITRVVGQAMNEHTLIRLEDPDEALKVLLLKNVELIVVDHTFFGDDVLAVEYGLEIKKRKKCHVFFTTRNEGRLIGEYRSRMSLYEEMDDYLVSPLDPVELSRKLKRASVLESRAAKRFPVDESVSLERVDNGLATMARLVDVSLVGFGIETSIEPILWRGEQVRIHVALPPFGIFHPQYGEILKLAGRVRRVSIAGARAGCSLEHLTPMQSDCLTRLLEQVARRNRLARMQEAPKPMKEPS